MSRRWVLVSSYKTLTPSSNETVVDMRWGDRLFALRRHDDEDKIIKRKTNLTFLNNQFPDSFTFMPALGYLFLVSSR